MDRKINVCIIIRSLANGGAEKQAILLAKALKEEYAVHLVMLSDKPKHHAHLDAIMRYGISHSYLQGKGIGKMKLFVKLLNELKTDIIFSYLPGDTFFAAIGGRLARVKYVYGGLRSGRIPEWKKRLGLRFVHNYLLDGTISNNHAGKDFYKKHGFKDEKTLVIPNGMVIENDYSPRQLKDEVIILSVGRFVPAKDYETAVKAISFMKTSKRLNKAFKYIIIGTGELEDQLRTWIKVYGCEEDIEIVLDPPNIPEYYALADIYFCSSFYEGFSNTLMEAASFSLPIVSTDAGDNAYLTIDKESGFISPIYDAKGLAEGLITLINEDTTRATMGKRSYEHLVNSYSYQVFQKKYMDFLSSLFPKKEPVLLSKTL